MTQTSQSNGLPRIILTSSPSEEVNYTIELLKYIPYSDSGLQAQPIESSILVDGKPDIIGWGLPGWVPSTDNALWLSAGNRLYRVSDDTLIQLPIPDGEMISGKVVLEDGLIVAYERTGNNDLILLRRLNMAGNILWEKVLPVDQRSAFPVHTAFLTDSDNTVYFYTGADGRLVRLDTSDGDEEIAYTFDASSIPLKVWILNNDLYWCHFEQGGYTHSWNRVNLQRQDRHVLKDSPLNNQFKSILYPTPDGGAVINDGFDLIWMAEDGTELQRITANNMSQVEWSGHRLMPIFRNFNLQSPGSYIYAGSQEDGIYIFRLRLLQ